MSDSDARRARELGPLLQSSHEPDCRQPKPAANSLRVWSPSALAVPEARSPRVFLARHLPTSGFLTLLPVYFFRNLPALFHAGNALGVFLQGLFPSTEPSPSLECGNLRDVERKPNELQVTLIFTRLRLSTSRLCSPRRFAICCDGVSHRHQTAALVVFGPLGFSSRRLPDAEAPVPLLHFTAVPDPKLASQTQ